MIMDAHNWMGQLKIVLASMTETRCEYQKKNMEVLDEQRESLLDVLKLIHIKLMVLKRRNSNLSWNLQGLSSCASNDPQAFVSWQKSSG
jgi:hypothetical protein